MEQDRKEIRIENNRVVEDKNQLYTMDGKPDKWKLVYYPLYQDGKTQEYYDEPRALMQNMDKPGFWSKEVPLRYLDKIK